METCPQAAPRAPGGRRMVLGAAAETALRLGDHSVRLYGQHLVKLRHTFPSWVVYVLGSSEG